MIWNLFGHADLPQLPGQGGVTLTHEEVRMLVQQHELTDRRLAEIGATLEMIRGRLDHLERAMFLLK